MKKLGFFFCVFTALLMASCSTTGTVWDTSIPPEKSAKICFMYFEVKSYNGINVDTDDFAIVTLPAGSSEFSGDIEWFSYAGNFKYIFTSKDAIFSCKLDAGEEYWAVVTFRSIESAGKNVRNWGINFYKDEIKIRIGFPPEEKLVAFIPFNPPVISN